MQEGLILMHKNGKMPGKMKYEFWSFALGRHGQMCVFVVYFLHFS